MNNPRIEVISFRRIVDAGESIWLSERLKGNCTIESARAKFYSGQEGTLRVKLFLWQTGRNVFTPLITFPQGVDDYLSGDDDYFEYPMIIDALLDDEIRVYVENVNDGGHSYHVSVDVVVDYFGGVNRVVGGVHSGR